jgi:hypothetical protein
MDIDEWTSASNRRYINISIFDQSSVCWNLGLVKLTGTASGYRILEFVQTRLAHFGIEMNRSIVNISTDGAKAMIKLGTFTEVSHYRKLKLNNRSKSNICI